MSQITSHVLDTARGCPAAGILIVLSRKHNDGALERLGDSITDADGRAKTLVPGNEPLIAGVYQLEFSVDSYFETQGVASFYPTVTIAFRVAGDGQHYHVPLLLSPFGYTTYRGS